MPSPAYINSYLKITSHNQATFEFDGESYSGRPKLNPAALESLKQTTDAKQYGSELFKALFPSTDDLLSGYRSALSTARRLNRRLRFHLQIDPTAPPDLFTLNWERLYDDKERQTFSLWAETAFSRLTGLNQQAPGAIGVKPKMLVVISSPANLGARRLEQIDVSQATNEIKEALEPLADIMDYEFLTVPATRSNIRESLKAGFHALHIQAHDMLHVDRVMARLLLEKDDGEADPVDEDFFAQIFNGMPDLRLVTLMACHSGAQTREDPFGGLALALVQQNFPAVIAMQQPISFDGAKIFNKHFYGELARHGQVDVAANEARLHLYLSSPRESDDWNAPVLFMRLKDGQLWDEAVAAHQPEVIVATSEDIIWEPILQALKQGQLIPIIGPDINHGMLPSNVDISRRWMRRYEYEKYNYPLDNRNDLPRIARFVEARNNSPKFPHRALLELFKAELLEREKTDDRAKLKDMSLPDVITGIAQRYFDKDPDAPHRILADLPIQTYLTTTPDNLMAEALKYRGRQLQRELLLWQEGVRDPGDSYQMLEGTHDSPIVWHLYGAAPKTPTLVLTEDDHLEFLRNVSKEPWRLPASLMEALTEGLLLFLGFNVRDLEFRVLFKGMISQLRGGSGRYAVFQIQPEKNNKERELDFKLIKNFFEQDSTGFEIDMRWLDVRDFLIKLRDKYLND